jgi:hypothetical protein
MKKEVFETLLEDISAYHAVTHSVRLVFDEEDLGPSSPEYEPLLPDDINILIDNILADNFLSSYAP